MLQAPTALRRFFFLAVTALLLSPVSGWAQVRIGSLGDSVTDEYQFYPPDRTAARNWVVFLNALRPSQVTFGSYTTDPLPRGETRNAGFAQNWARSGARAEGPDVAGANTIFTQQYDGYPNPGDLGLITQPGGLGNVDVVTILIGGNDYNYAIQQWLSGVGTLRNNLITANSDVILGISAAVNALRQAEPNVRIVLISTPDISVTPLAQLLPGSALALIHQFATQLTGLIMTLAQQENLPLIDSTALIDKLIAAGSFNGITLNTTEGGPSYTDLFVGDDFHPGSIAQGILAQQIVASINQIYGYAVITPISDNEITTFAQQPFISSGSYITLETLTPLLYVVTASNNPTSITVSGLPFWASYHPELGAVIGFPVEPGVYHFTVTATNAFSTSTEEVTIDVYDEKASLVAGLAVPSPSTPTQPPSLIKPVSPNSIPVASEIIVMTGPSVTVKAPPERTVNVQFTDGNGNPVYAAFKGSGRLTIDKLNATVVYQHGVMTYSGSPRFTVTGAADDTSLGYYPRNVAPVPVDGGVNSTLASLTAPLAEYSGLLASGVEIHLLDLRYASLTTGPGRSLAPIQVGAPVQQPVIFGQINSLGITPPLQLRFESVPAVTLWDVKTLNFPYIPSNVQVSGAGQVTRP